jgi:hypothetical protein
MICKKVRNMLSSCTCHPTPVGRSRLCGPYDFGIAAAEYEEANAGKNEPNSFADRKEERSASFHDSRES